MKYWKIVWGGLGVLTIGGTVWYLQQNHRPPEVTSTTARSLQEKQTVIQSGKVLLSPMPMNNRSSIPAPAKSELSVAVRNIIDDSLNISERIKLANSLPGNLSEAERHALYEYLKHGVDLPGSNHLKNDLLNTLRNQLTPPPELTQVMLDIFYDTQQNMAMRSYALQHMRPWYWEENMRDPAIKKAFYDGLDQTNNELSGVALLALNYLAEELPSEFDRTFIAEKAAIIAGDSSGSELSRITALDVSSRFGNDSVLPVARKILQDDTENVMLLAAACGVIGRQGNVSDLELLDKSVAKQRAIQRAVAVARQKIERRMFSSTN